MKIKGVFIKEYWRDPETGACHFAVRVKNVLLNNNMYVRKELIKNSDTGKEENWYTIICAAEERFAPVFDPLTPVEVEGSFEENTDNENIDKFIVDSVKETYTDRYGMKAYIMTFEGMTDSDADSLAFFCSSGMGHDFSSFVRMGSAAFHASRMSGEDKEKMVNRVKEFDIKNNLLRMLLPAGVSYSDILNMISKYGLDMEKKLKQDPYEGLNYGMSRKMCDDLRETLKINAGGQSVIRLRKSHSEPDYSIDIASENKGEPLRFKGIFLKEIQRDPFTGNCEFLIRTKMKVLDERACLNKEQIKSKELISKTEEWFTVRCVSDNIFIPVFYPLTPVEVEGRFEESRNDSLLHVMKTESVKETYCEKADMIPYILTFDGMKESDANTLAFFCSNGTDFSSYVKKGSAAFFAHEMNDEDKEKMVFRIKELEVKNEELRQSIGKITTDSGTIEIKQAALPGGRKNNNAVLKVWGESSLKYDFIDPYERDKPLFDTYKILLKKVRKSSNPDEILRLCDRFVSQVIGGVYDTFAWEFGIHDSTEKMADVIGPDPIRIGKPWNLDRFEPYQKDITEKNYRLLRGEYGRSIVSLCDTWLKARDKILSAEENTDERTDDIKDLIRDEPGLFISKIYYAYCFSEFGNDLNSSAYHTGISHIDSARVNMYCSAYEQEKEELCFHARRVMSYILYYVLFNCKREQEWPAKVRDSQDFIKDRILYLYDSKLLSSDMKELCLEIKNVTNRGLHRLKKSDISRLNMVELVRNVDKLTVEFIRLILKKTDQDYEAIINKIDGKVSYRGLEQFYELFPGSDEWKPLYKIGIEIAKETGYEYESHAFYPDIRENQLRNTARTAIYTRQLVEQLIADTIRKYPEEYEYWKRDEENQDDLIFVKEHEGSLFIDGIYELRRMYGTFMHLETGSERMPYAAEFKYNLKCVFRDYKEMDEGIKDAESLLKFKYSGIASLDSDFTDRLKAFIEKTKAEEEEAAAQKKRQNTKINIKIVLLFILLALSIPFAIWWFQSFLPGLMHGFFR